MSVPERNIPDTDKYSQTACIEVECGCGARYLITTVRMRNAERMTSVALDYDHDKDRGWQ
jgi:hypothetical protein